MKRIYNILCVFLFAVFMLVGLFSTFDKDATFSEAERRPLKTRPKVTISGLLDGSYVNAYREYYADTFPGREGLMDSNTKLNMFYYFSGLASDDDASLVIDFNTNAAAGGESLKNPDATTEPSTEGEGETEPTKNLPQQTEPQESAEQLGNVLLVGDRAMDVPYMNRATIQSFARAINSIAEDLGPSVKTYFMPVPNDAEFYTGKEYHTGNFSQADMFRICKETLNSNVTYIDAYSVLAQHTDEYIYFRTDHHWTHLGAYYAYTALCKSMGMTPVNRDDFDTGKWENFLGSMYNYLAEYPQSSVLRNNPDTVHYWKPSVECTTYYYSNTNLTNGVLMGTICRVPEEESNKYLTFMGGDHPITIVTTETEGPCIMLIKESYSNALISWLTNHFSKIVLVDPREYFNANSTLDLDTFAHSQDVDICLIVNYPIMLNSENYVAKLNKLTD
jgi:hypothetical protein